MTCDHLRRFLAISIIASIMSMASTFAGTRHFQKKVSVLLEKEPESPKCFAESRKDFTCFWEEDEERAGSVDQYSFTYAYENDNSRECPLTTQNMPGGKRLYICHLTQISMFVRMDIEIHREGRLIHNRSLQVEFFFLLDPPANVTVDTTGQEGQLNVSWIPPLKYMDDSFMYEVSYAMVDSHTAHVDVVRASSRMILRSLQPATQYKPEDNHSTNHNINIHSSGTLPQRQLILFLNKTLPCNSMTKYLLCDFDSNLR
ncbi:erythropoietin receptor-like isoform X2 [Syngnathoides biaculeatus]|uniref:erythropoietin receptor-like isoform X2 n=1 Tax=Syngnathoides biaculeatus TaxID=300417 RepID=UPI002ADE6B19|nr:erythropoietin receptor-like isoform X2 [Syngnathoides biaculeatus]